MVTKAKKNTDERSAWTSVLFVLLLASLVMGLLAFIVHTRHLAKVEQYLAHAGELRLLGNKISAYAFASGSGVEAAFTSLKDSRQEFIQLMDELKDTAQKSTQAAPESAQLPLQEVESVWLELRSKVDAILNSKEAILSLHEAIDGIRSAIPDLLRVSASAATGMLASKASKDQVYYATRQLFIAQRIQSATSELWVKGSISTMAVDQLTRDLMDLKSVVHALLKGDASLGIEAVTDANIQRGLLEASAILGDMDDSLRMLEDRLQDAMPALKVLSEADKAETVGVGITEKQVLPDVATQGELAATADELGQKLSDLALSYSGNTSSPLLGPMKVEPVLIIQLGAVAIGLVLILGMLLLANAKKRRRFSAGQDQHNQESIHRLLDEMRPMVDGDLSVEATVGDDDTGAIADSVNQINDVTRGLVASINKIGTKAYSSVQENRATIMHLAETSEHQRDQVGTVSRKINTVAQALAVMTKEADASANTAAQSVELIKKGANAVHQTVSGMTKIGEQNHKALAGVKRLHENLQEAEELVELVEDVADKTNVLALNAAMQAAVAGEAGRGFAVVADGMQRQAERFSSVSKQIEEVVEVIRGEADKGVDSMESNAAEVFSATHHAENANSIMQEVVGVSEKVAGLASKFAEYARVQSGSAVSISDSMGIIREISQQNSESADNTILTIGELAGDIDGIRSAGAGFVLPDREN